MLHLVTLIRFHFLLKNVKQSVFVLFLPDEEALCPVVFPPWGSDKFHINSCLIHAASP